MCQKCNKREYNPEDSSLDECSFAAGSEFQVSQVSQLISLFCSHFTLFWQPERSVGVETPLIDHN